MGKILIPFSLYIYIYIYIYIYVCISGKMEVNLAVCKCTNMKKNGIQRLIYLQWIKSSTEYLVFFFICPFIYIYIYIYIHIYLYIYISVCVCVCMCVLKEIRISPYIYIYIYSLKSPAVSSHTEELWYNKTVNLWMTIFIYIYIYIYKCVCECVCVCVCMCTKRN